MNSETTLRTAVKCCCVLAGLMLAGCSQDHRQSVASPSATHRESTVRGSLAPSAPVQLTYRVPATIAANQTATIEVAVNTRLTQGSLLVEIVGHEGATLLGDTQYRYDLAAVTARPIPLQLQVLPADQADRFLAILVSVDTEMGTLARSFRIDLNTPVPPADANPLPSGSIIQQ